MDTAAPHFDFDSPSLAAASRRLGLSRVVLFGSHATLQPPPDANSDVDIAIALSVPPDASRFWEIQNVLAPIFGDRSLDLVFLADADPLFRWEIVRAGILLYGDPLEYLEYRAFAYRDFVDSADLRALERVLFEKKMDYIRRRLHAAA